MINKEILLVSIFGLFLSFSVQAQQNIYINQVGYQTTAAKQVYIDYKATDFEIYNTVTGKVVYKNSFNLHKKNDPNSGLTLYKGDFSELKLSGTFLVKINGSENSGITSYPFKISDTVFSNTIQLANKSLFLQRCGLEMEEKFVGQYARNKCHLDEAAYHPFEKRAGAKDISGGWHDAGDYGKYVAPGSVTIGILLTAYELNPEKFASDSWNIPESGNGIPDLLDEIKYELDWLFKMQRTDGAVHEKVHTKDYVQFIMPSEGNVPQFIYQVSSTATADFAAIMAHSSRTFKSSDENFATKCLDAAKRAYNYLEEYPEIFPSGGFKNPPDTKAGGYSDAFDKDERIWAAAELFIATGKKKFMKDFEMLNEHFKSEFSIVGWQNPATFAYYSLLMNDEIKTTEKLRLELKGKLKEYCDKQVAISKKDGFEIAMTPNSFTWGSNGTVLFKAINFLIGYEFTENQDYLDLATNHLNYILGTNPNKISYVTGVGTNRILHLHHAPTVSDMNVDPIPGILTGGPNKFRNDNSLMKTFNENTPPARIYLDNEESYSSNENTIYTNASLVFVASYLNGSLK